MSVESYEFVRLGSHFLVDCAVAYVAHHFAPHLPTPSFFRKYFSWVRLVGSAFPVQLLVYESYPPTTERPLVVWLIMVLVPIVAGAAWLCYEIYYSTFASRIMPGVILNRYRRFRRTAWTIMIVLASFYLAFVAVWLWWVYQPRDNHIVVVARFAGPSPEVYSPTDDILSELRTATQSAPGTIIIPAKLSVTSEEGPEAAIRLGRALVGHRNDATLVVWGFYKVSSSGAMVDVHIEFLLAGQLLSSAPVGGFDAPRGLNWATRQRDFVPLELLNTFRFQPQVAEEVRARMFYILGLMQLLTGEHAKARSLLDQANKGAELEIQIPDERLAHPGTHEQSPFFDYVIAQRTRERLAHPGSDADKPNKVTVSGRSNVLTARGWANLHLGWKALQMGQYRQALAQATEAELDCAGAALISPKDAAAYPCLGNAHELEAELLQSKPEAVNRELVEGILALGIGDCSRAIQLDPEYTKAYACRGEQRFLIAELDSFEPSCYGELPATERYYRDALADWTRVIDANPGDYDALERRGELWWRLYQCPKAEEDFTRSIEINRKYFHAFNNRGIVRGLLGRWDEAFSDLEQAVESGPKWPEAWCNLGKAARATGRLPRAREAFRRCLDLATTPEMRDFARQELRRTQ